jgi:hypothetical protein
VLLLQAERLVRGDFHATAEYQLQLSDRTTVLSKSCAGTMADGETGGHRSGASSLAGVEEDRNEDESRNDFAQNHQTSPKLQRVGSDVLHARHHRLGAETKGLG